jgi:hypothetical protein
LVEGVTRWLESCGPAALVEAFARIAPREWAREHQGQSPSPSSPEYLRFVVERCYEIGMGIVGTACRDAGWARGLHAAMGQFPSIIDEFNRNGLHGSNAAGVAAEFYQHTEGRITADEIVAAAELQAEFAIVGAMPLGKLGTDNHQRLIQRLLDIINAEVVEPAIRAEREAEDKRVAAEINAK